MLKFIQSHVATVVVTAVAAIVGAAFTIGLLIGQANAEALRRELELYERLKPDELKSLTSSLADSLASIKLSLAERAHYTKLKSDIVVEQSKASKAVADAELVKAQLTAIVAGEIWKIDKSNRNKAVLIGKEWVNASIAGQLALVSGDLTAELRPSQSFKTKKGCLLTLVEIVPYESATLHVKC